MAATPLPEQVSNWATAIEAGVVGQDWSKGERDGILLALTVAGGALRESTTPDATEASVVNLLTHLNEIFTPS